jgi:hypothetical protein
MAGGTFGPTFVTPFFTGTAGVSEEIPGYLPIAIGAHAYLIDPSQYRRDTVDVLRTQADPSGEPGESSLNPKGLWRRTQESWHHGAGQRFLDGRDSDRARFRTSKGINPWTEGQLSLLNDTASRRSSANTNLQLVALSGYLYVSDGTQLYHTTDPTAGSPTWTSADIQAGQAAQTVNSIATNGYHVWAALGSSGLHRTTRGATSSTADVPGTACTLVGYALGRLLIANANVLYEVLPAITAPVATALPGVGTHPNSDFVWSVIAEGRNVIYAAGNSGDKAEIYRITLNPSDTALAAPVFATYLPDGELIHAIQFYAGGVILGTSKGLRLATADGQGNLDYGPLIETTSAVRALEPQDRYVFFSATNYDGTSSGLYRADLGWQTSSLVPAYASDLMGTAQGAVTSVATFGTRRYFAVSGVGIYGEATTKVASGTLETGAIRFGTTESKTSRSVDLRHHLLDGSVAVEYKADNGDWESLGSSNVAASIGPDVPISARDDIAETTEFRFTLARSATDTTLGPEMVRWTFKALPTPRREWVFILPILMRSYVDNQAGDGLPIYQDVVEEMAYLADIETSGRLVNLQVGTESYTVFLDQHSFRGEHWEGPERKYMEGLYVISAQTVQA